MSLLRRLLRREDPHSLAAPYALDALEPAERVRFERHLARCERCAAEVRALGEDAVRLAWSAAAAPPAALRERVLAAVRATPQEQPAREHTPQLPPHVWGVQPPPRRNRAPRPRPLLVPFATATAAAALVVASLFAVQADRTQDRLTAERDRSREIAHVLAAPDAQAATGLDARGRSIGVIASVSEGRAVVTLRGYGALPGGRVHQLWLMRPGAQPRSLGLFSGDTPLVASGLDRSATSLAVTVEPGGGSPRPTSQPVVQLALESVGFGE
ncbi:MULTISPECIES: anti-sigma factor domain-containing protein [unclassified Streptomyces]|uniref:anti-sigma factor n=1 Tax=unclassified Streptomyces TaxID=2593676 RepID=UPI001F047066|nr:MULTISPECIES: anti-sigma factor [unclassified Streptomyces]MCH0567105.1 anti-sigma factor [Streptomyces sp. MUM 2J]MCH0569793.1 anti-sigma factor [Streptomyces sp. MUM 136J]